jgi:AraC-like DNA-binding protein
VTPGTPGALGSSPGGRASARLRRAREFIDERFDEPIDLALMARQAGLSRYRFLRAFRNEFHETLHHYLRERRIERAEQLLAAGERSVAEVCFEVGFASLGSFCTLLHRLVGQPPGRYRARRLVVVPGIGARPAQFVPACQVRLYAA